MDVVAKKNKAYPALVTLWSASNPNVAATGQVATLTIEAYYSDNANPAVWTSFTPAGSGGVVEVDATGVYCLLLTASEMNHDLIVLKMQGEDSAETTLVIHAYAADLGDLGLVKSIDGGSATIAGMIARLFDGANGDNYVSSRDSLLALRQTWGADQYWADIDLSPNEDDSLDLWTVLWKKNAQHVPAASISNSRISVYSRSDGSALVSDQAMTLVGASGALKYDAAGEQRVDFGQHYIVVVTASIEGETREYRLIKER